MLNTRTLFVIGAGAGAELNMPLGGDLSATIAKDVYLYYDAGFLTKGDKQISRALTHVAREEHLKMDDLILAGRMISEGIRHTKSIDNYLHAHSDKLAVKIVAKTAIVKAIIAAERRSFLYTDETRGRFQHDDRVYASWLSAFFTLLQEDIVESKNLDKIFKNTAIINFNYDRCIEHYLYNVLQMLYPTKGDGYVRDLINRSLKIVHPYGTIGNLPWQSGSFPVKFGEELSDAQLAMFSKHIHTFNEQIEEEHKLAEIRKLVEDAETIVFLGFHFHKQNMDVLTPPEHGAVKRPRVFILATQVDRSAADISRITLRIQTMLNGRNISPVSGFEAECDCKALFKRYASALSP